MTSNAHQDFRFKNFIVCVFSRIYYDAFMAASTANYAGFMPEMALKRGSLEDTSFFIKAYALGQMPS
ncbi:hypothetical protein GNY06_01035 [Elizabethkingia argentiflava]|uniref:Uncharacterized protein n=1 Tax=Elizabethkingia argenteiflava TaxID=2681556 RepID=A0A845PQC5_9FLAO|nr:hypothetical protein [Elizabethkingia argenteiflava]